MFSMVPSLLPSSPIWNIVPFDGDQTRIVGTTNGRPDMNNQTIKARELGRWRCVSEIRNTLASPIGFVVQHPKPQARLETALHVAACTFR